MGGTKKLDYKLYITYFSFALAIHLKKLNKKHQLKIQKISTDQFCKL